MNTSPPKLRRHEKYGYYYYPVNQDELDGYYANSYADPLATDVPIELQWKRETLWTDILEFARHNRGGVLDIGSGNGEFANFLRSKGIYAATVDKNGKADYATIEDVQWWSQIATCTILNALEHVSDPFKLLRDLAYLGMARDNVLKSLVVRVPNDFNRLQRSLEVEHGQYWLHYPDHINYFGVESLTALLEDTGWHVTRTQCDWPMEFFLTSGGIYDYLQSESAGAANHDFRRQLELNMPSDIRQELWTKFAEMGIGRNIIAYAERK